MDTLGGCCAIILIMIAIGVYESAKAKEKGYMEGQIDALSGNIKYQLQTQSDSSTIWVEIQ